MCDPFAAEAGVREDVGMRNRVRFSYVLARLQVPPEIWVGDRLQSSDHDDEKHNKSKYRTGTKHRLTKSTETISGRSPIQHDSKRPSRPFKSEHFVSSDARSAERVEVSAIADE